MENQRTSSSQEQPVQHTLQPDTTHRIDPHGLSRKGSAAQCRGQDPQKGGSAIPLQMSELHLPIFDIKCAFILRTSELIHSPLL